jgi:hypothetical protein
MEDFIDKKNLYWDLERKEADFLEGSLEDENE